MNPWSEGSGNIILYYTYVRIIQCHLPNILPINRSHTLACSQNTLLVTITSLLLQPIQLLLCGYICAHKTCCKETVFVESAVVKRSDCILVYGSTTKGVVVKRYDCILVYGSTIKGDVVKRSDCKLVYGSTTKGVVAKRYDCILVYGSTIKGDVVKRSDCIPKVPRCDNRLIK